MTQQRTRNDNGDGRHDDGKGQNGEGRHDNGNGRHNDGKGQQGDGQHNDGNGRHDEAARQRRRTETVGTTTATGGTTTAKLIAPAPRASGSASIFYFDLLEIFMEVPVLAFDT